MSGNLTTIYVQLLEEGTKVYRPVAATRLPDGTFMITMARPDDEVWEFDTGSTVVCEQRVLSGGRCDVAVRRQV